jgi:hypothetical protein
MLISTIANDMGKHRLEEETKEVIRKVMEYWRQHEVVDKKAFVGGVDIITKQVAIQTGEPVEQVYQYTKKVLTGFSEDFKKLPAEEKTHEDMILMIYIRYLHHMGMLDDE